MEDSNDRRIPWALFASELIGTAVLVLVGLSLVIFLTGFGTGKETSLPTLLKNGLQASRLIDAIETQLLTWVGEKG